MDRDTRNRLRNAVVQCRKVLEEDILGQLEGTFGIHKSGSIEQESALPHLDAAGLDVRRRAVASIEHIAGFGMRPADAIDQFQREAAFTHLNRLCAFKIMERRGLLDETVSRGFDSNGFKVYLAGHEDDMRLWNTGQAYAAYRNFLFDVCDRLDDEIKVLFDVEHISSHLFPGQRALEAVLSEINAAALVDIWESDETLGWIYQYFTPKELRDKARKESAAPRNSYELAFRNQFYTPRYVVEFLTDNTLGRLWYEMRNGETALVGSCRYMVRRKRPVFLARGEDGPEPFDPSARSVFFEGGNGGEMWTRPNPDIEDIESIFRYALTVDGYSYAQGEFGVDCAEIANPRLEKYRESKKWEGSFEELRCCLFFEQRRWRHFGEQPQGDDEQAILSLYGAICQRWDLETEYIPHRDKKLPWEMRILDPACGSGHFLLYAFDLLEQIYEEAYDDPDLGPQVQRWHPERQKYRADIPGLILRNNLHGIDIDLRSTQIAALVLWLRAQRSFQRIGLKGAARPPIDRSNIVCAEPMPGDENLLEEFCAALSPSVLGDLVREVWDRMKLAGEAGSLLRMEEEIRSIVKRAQEAWRKAPRGYRISLFDGTVERPTEQAELDFSDLTEPAFWHEAEELLLSALDRFTRQATNGAGYGRQLFRDDAAQGFAFIDLCRQRYDVALMNPPFGEPARFSKLYINEQFEHNSGDIFQAFVERGLDWLTPNGLEGVISARTGFFLGNSKGWREEVVFSNRMVCFADLGLGVLDDALVEVATYVIEHGHREGGRIDTSRQLDTREKEPRLLEVIEGTRAGRQPALGQFDQSLLELIPDKTFAYWAPSSLLRRFSGTTRFGSVVGKVRQGVATADDFRFARLGWEVPNSTIGRGKRWQRFSKGGEYSPPYDDVHLLVDWLDDGAELAASPNARFQNLAFMFKPGATYTVRTASAFAAKVLPEGCVFSHNAQSWFTDSSDRTLLSLGYLSTRVPQTFLELSVGSGDIATAGSAARRYTTAVVEGVPSGPLEAIHTPANLASIRELFNFRLSEFKADETSCHFAAFHFVPGVASMRDAASRFMQTYLMAAIDALSESQKIDAAVCGAFELSGEESSFVEDEVGPHPMSYPEGVSIEEIGRLSKLSIEQLMAEAVAQFGSKRWFTKKSFFVDRRLEIMSHFLRASPVAIAKALMTQPTASELRSFIQSALSEAIGFALARWDIRCATDPSLGSHSWDPFDALPICAPGMLVGVDELPARSGGMVSEDWLRAKAQNGGTPPDGSSPQSLIGDAEYPLRIVWDGILVDDQEHEDDIVRSVLSVIETLYSDKAGAVEHESCEVLGVRGLRDYFRNPRGFWADHLSRYSKSRRKAPIYWLLQSPRRHYALWLYYQRLDKDMLLKALRNFVDPKLNLERNRLNELRDHLKATPDGRESKALENQLEDQEGVVLDVEDFRARLERVASLGLDPDLNDGVILNIAPLHELVPWKEPKQYWEDLLAGKYEWSSISKQLREKGLVRG